MVVVMMVTTVFKGGSFYKEELFIFILCGGICGVGSGCGGVCNCCISFCLAHHHHHNHHHPHHHHYIVYT